MAISDRRKERRAAQRESDPDIFARQQREWRAANKQRARDRARAWYQANRDRVLSRLRDKRTSLRVEMLAAYGGACECCGESTPGFLTIDHVNGGGRQHRDELGMAGNLIAEDLKRKGWPKGEYRLLCYNCNCGRAHNGGSCPHEAAGSK